MVYLEIFNFYYWFFKMILVFNVFFFKMINIFLGFYFKRKWFWKDKVIFLSFCIGFFEREKGMLRKWGRMFRERIVSKLGFFFFLF